MNIKLGQTVVDVTTGFKGIAINRTEFMNGNIQFSVQPPAKDDNSYPDSISIDYHMLEVANDGVSDRATQSSFVSPVKLGDEVKCLVTGIRGIATMKTNYLNGCSSFLVTEKQKNGTVNETWVDQHKLKVVGSGITEKYSKPEANDGKPTGGPVMRGIPRY